MGELNNKRILLGVTGSIAAYKSADLIRQCRRAGAEVQVVMSQAAEEFITAQTLQALSGKPVRSHLLDTEAEAAMGHIELARWADLILVAPTSADFMARLVQGRADDLLTAVCLASDSPLALAPAMNHVMWSNAATQANCQTLIKRGVTLLGPDIGDQACGETGPGRMLEPLAILPLIIALFNTGSLVGVNVMITAGPTQENIDPVRYISNRSSGKTGYALARAAAEAGARVTLVSGPVSLPVPEGVQCIKVRSAQAMYDEVIARVGKRDLFIAAAAVADYRPVASTPDKIRKAKDTFELALEPTADIIAEVASTSPTTFTVGFAAETGDLDVRAEAKRAKKGLDIIVGNQVGIDDEGQPFGFDSDENTLSVYQESGILRLPKAHKNKLARKLITIIAKHYHEKNSGQDTR